MRNSYQTLSGVCNNCKVEYKLSLKIILMNSRKSLEPLKSIMLTCNCTNPPNPVYDIYFLDSFKEEI